MFNFHAPATLTAAIQCLARTTLRLQPLCLYTTVYSLSHKHRWWDRDDGNKVGWWWGGMVIWDVDGGVGGWVVDGGGVVFYLLYIGFIAGYCRWPCLWTWCERSWSFRTLGLLAVQVVGPGTFSAPFKSNPCSTLTALVGHFSSIRGLVLLQH